jgi:NAD-dependent deacetylase
MDILIETIAQRLEGKILILTGSGLSADSGLPTFWGKDGIYEGRKVEELATRNAFEQNPENAWKFYDWRRALVQKAQPNPGHQAITRLAKRARQALVVTQNVDDLHERAGTPPGSLIHIHGEILRTRCLECDAPTDRRDDDSSRLCACGGRLRPNVVLFGESLGRDNVHHIETWIADGPSDAVLVVGTAARFPYIIDWAVRAAGDSGAIVEVNPNETGLTPAAHLLRGNASEILPSLLRPLQSN